MSTSEAKLDQAFFPEVPEEARPRPLYFQTLTPLDRAMLKERGYAPMCLLELPRNSPEQEVAYLMAKVQGIEEGTVYAGEAAMEALELEMKAYNLLAQKHMVVRFDMSEKQRHKSIDDVLSTWGKSRHTLRGNSTVQGMQLPDIGRKQLVSGQGKRPKGDTARGKQKRQRGK